MRESERMVRYFLEMAGKLPVQYGWRVTGLEAFKEQVRAATADEDMNRIYWHDMARMIEAYGVTVMWRGGELISSAIRSLNARDILAPAVVSRSLLELAASVLVNCNAIRKTVAEATAKGTGVIVVAPELETLVIRMLYGTRLGGNDYLKQTNALTFIQRLSQNPEAAELLSVYEYLCEVAHPNVVGNARFWSIIESRSEGGSETLKIEPNVESDTTRAIQERALWALGWSAASIRNGFEIGRAAVTGILERWPKKP